MATRNLERMGEVMRDTDLVIVSGDLTNFGGEADAGKVIDDVRRRCSNVLALPGNLDRREVVPFLEREGVALHGRGMVRDGVAIFDGNRFSLQLVRSDLPKFASNNRDTGTPEENKASRMAIL